MSSSVRLDRVTKRYGDHFAADDVSLDIGTGRFVTLLGPSGSGKTTLLMMIAGFVRPTSGRVFAGGVDITDQPPERRDFGMVFQGYALFPNMTVAENVAFPLKLRRRSREAIAREVKHILDVVHLPGLGQRYPRELSGGQQQRVALARALIFNPKVLLLDESLSALDKKLRAGLQDELRDLHNRLGTTFVFVTHDQDEALSMSDEIVIINHGKVVQSGSPKALYDRPRTRFAADFLGRANFVAATIDAARQDSFSYLAEGRVFRQSLAAGDVPPQPGQKVEIAIRPEMMVVSDEEPTSAANRLPGEISSVTYEGASYYIRAATPLGTMQIVLPASGTASQPARGDRVWFSWADHAAVVLRHDG